LILAEGFSPGEWSESAGGNPGLKPWASMKPVVKGVVASGRDFSYISS